MRTILNRRKSTPNSKAELWKNTLETYVLCVIFLTVRKLGKDAGVLTNYEIRPSSLVENERRQLSLLAKRSSDQN